MKRNASRTKSFRIALLGPALAVLAAPVWAQGQKPASARYNVTDLGTLGESFSLAYGINNRGRIDGFSTLPGDSSVHSFVLENGVMIDLGTLGGPDSQSFAGLNEATQLVLEWLSLTKIGDRFGIQPEGIIQSAVQFWACSTGTASAIRASVWGTAGNPAERGRAAPSRGENNAETRHAPDGRHCKCLRTFFHVSLRRHAEPISVLKCWQHL
jgi:probable HAF family extracellular repeat protein